MSNLPHWEMNAAVERTRAGEEAQATSIAERAPHVLLRPAIMADGDQWCMLLGEDLQIGVSGFGATPAEAAAAFDKAWREQRTPAAILASAADHGKTDAT